MVSYKPLWHTLLSHDMKKMDLVARSIVSRATLAKMGKGCPGGHRPYLLGVGLPY